MSLTRAYEDGKLVAEGFPVEEVSDHLVHPGRVVFADLTGEDTGSITRTQGGDFALDAVFTVWDGQPHLARFGVSFLLHGLLDHVAESYLAAMEVLDDQAEQLEDDLFDGHAPGGRP